MSRKPSHMFTTTIKICLATLLVIEACMAAASSSATAGKVAEMEPVYIYRQATRNNADFYDENIALVTMQGIVNRSRPSLYFLNNSYPRPEYWLDVLSKDGRWLEGRKRIELPDIDAVRELAGKQLKGAVIWDPEVPATLNVATTIAGVEDAVVLSPEYAKKYLAAWKIPVIKDLRGMFTGKETGSAKNDAYRWAIRQYLAKGKCSAHFLCLYTDSVGQRDLGGIAYSSVRDWAVKNRAFVFDLSPWGDEVPGDDPHQPMGTDLATYKLILAETLKHSAGKHMTEVTGFFNFQKYSNMPGHPSKHEPVPTEWETVWLISPYNCYQNTATEMCFNQSFHSHAPFKPLKQARPKTGRPLENKVYIAVLMADYDSAFPLYDFLPKNWDDGARGKMPLNWGINPNLTETYPDLVSYFYETASPNDHFVADASCAGYLNPNRVEKQYLPLLVTHNKRFYDRTDLTISGMVLDWDQPTAGVKDAFSKFSQDGFATIVMDLHGNGGGPPAPQVWKGMPVIELHNNADYADSQQAAQAMVDTIKGRDPDKPAFFYFRRVWVSPSAAIEAARIVGERLPGQVEFVDLYTLLDLFKRHMASDTPK